MKKALFTFLALGLSVGAFAQAGPGLVISEMLPNPAGTDSPFEFVELVATRTINFATTPYSVIVCNNGVASTAGWMAGGALTYSFEINTGTVNQGDVVYVGGSSMAVTGTILRSINTGTTGGDGLGTANTGGVFGNGGTNADGIGVFALPIASITNTTVPVDAVFYGTGVGTAVVNAGVDGYQMPINDLYTGGKLQSTAFLAPDAASAQFLTATGTFNPVTGAFTTVRSWVASTTFTNNATGITLSTATPAVTLALATTNQTVNENAGTATVTVNVSNANGSQVVFSLAALPFSNATLGTDYTASATQFVIPAGSTAAQTLTINITDDVLAEKDEYIVLAFTQLSNATTVANAAHYLYIKDNDTQAPVGTNELFLDLQASFSNGSSATNSAEIVAHDPATQRLYIANSIGAKLDIVNFSNPAAPVLINSINISTYGNINSVAVNDSVVAMAIENGTNPQDSGKIVFLNYNGVFISQVKVGAMPDMITFNHAGNKVLVACEGEPNTTYTSDPDGSIAIVNISGNLAALTQSQVSFITFTAYNGQETALRAQGIRIYGLGASASKDFEPEYITISDNDQTAWVTLQENNAIAEINLQTNAITALRPLGFKDWNTGNNAMDISDQTAGINLSSFPVKGMYQPDALSHYMVGNQNYLVTANEGDSRAYTAFNEEARIGAMSLDATVFPYAAYMKSNLFMGRLNATNKLGDLDNDGDFDELYVYGARSFSIWNATTGALVYDSGDQLERITSTNPLYSAMFNASNTTSAAPKNRSDDKGPEPEGTAVATINGEQYAFIGLERIGGAMMYNVTNPAAPVFVGYANNRTFASNGPDRGTEGIIYIADSLSPTGHALLILANETSSTLSIYQITTCAERAGVAITPATPAAVCAGNTVALTATNVSNTTYQWLQNNTAINAATTNTYTASTTGAYQVLVASTANACVGKTDYVNVTVNPLPTVAASTSASTICNGSPSTLTATGATTYNWMPGSLSGASVTVNPTTTTTYTLTGTNANGCSNTSTVAVTVNALPTVAASSSAPSVCVGSPATLTGTGAATYNWMPGALSGSSVTVNPTATTTYTLTGTDANGCSNTSTVAVSVNTLPTVTATTTATSICSGSNVTLSSTGATTYNWQPGSLTGASVVVNPTANTTYTVTGTNANGCTNTATVVITALPRPTIAASTATPALCSGNAVTMTATGATVFAWLPGLLTGSSVTTIPTATTTYTVTGTASNGCNNTATLTITVNASPVVSATSSSTSICGADSVQFTANGATTYMWMPGNLVGSSINELVNATTTYSVVGTAANGCTDSTVVSVTVNTIPVVSLSLNPDTLCLGDAAIQLVGSPVGGAFSGPGVQGNIFNPAFASLGNNTLMYMYTDANGCSNMDSAIAFVDLCTGIATVEQEVVNVYPNPFATNLSVTANETIERLEVYDLSGQLIYNNNYQSDRVELSTENFASGIYLLRVFTNTGVSVVRISKM